MRNIADDNLLGGIMVNIY